MSIDNLEILTKYKHIGIYEQSPYKFKEIASELGWDFSKIKIIHVLGTNGKGSVCHFLNNVITTNNKVGLFTSPHVINANERIQISHEPIPEEIFMEIIHKQEKIIHNYLLNFFEIYLLVAMIYFLNNKINVMIIEAGIGGIFDSTNFFKKIDYMCVTSISLDHTEILGNTLKSIINQKFGVVKFSHKKIVTYLEQPKLILLAKLIVALKLKKLWNINAIANYQKNNAAIAITILLDMGYSANEINAHINEYQLTKSWEEFVINKKITIIDGAHNEDGIIKLCETMKKLNLDNSDTAIIFNAREAKKPANLLNIFKESGFNNIYIYLFLNSTNKIDLKNIPSNLYKKAYKDLNECYKEHSKKYKTIIFTGSLYFIGEVKKTFNYK